MANSDGQVRIIIDTNANEAVKELDKTSNAFKKSGKSAQDASTLYGEYSQVISENIEIMREMALGNMENSKRFQELARQTKDYQEQLNRANSIVDKATNGAVKQENGMQSLINAGKNLIGGYVGLQGAIKAFNFAMESVDAYRVQERAIIGLNTALKNAGVYTDEYSAHLQNLASEIQSYSNFGDEAILKAQGVAQAFMGSVPMTDALTKAVVDFAAAMDMDLEQAFTLVGKSIGSSTNALGRYGVELGKGMTDSQKMAAITKQLGDRYKGQAAQMADANVQLKNSVGDLKEAFGSSLNGYVTRWQSGMRTMVEATTKFINSIRIMKADVADLNMQELTQRYQKNMDVVARMESQSYYNKGGGLQLKIAKLEEQQRIRQQMQFLRQQAKRTSNITPIKFKDDDFGISSTSAIPGGSSAKSAKEVKDAFEQAQAEAQKAEKAFKLALYQSGGNVTPAVEQARLKMVDTKKAVEDVQKAYENLTAKTKTPFEQLNYNIEQSRQKIISLASQPVVNLEAIRQAQTEYQGLLAQQEQINSYLQPVKGAYQELNDKISELTLNLKNLSAEHKVGTTEWVNVQTQLKETQTELDNVNKSLTDNGVKLEDYGKQISSSISSGLVNALRNGGNAFDAFSSLATTALQKVLDKLIEMSFVTPVLNAFTGGTGGTLFSGIAKIFGSANGNVFRNGNVIPFAKGGVVNQPTIFPMANGGTGLMGEAGAEAVMPLHRMSNGRLGVEAENENGKAVQVNIYNQSGANVETRKRDDGSMDIFIRKVNEALSSERTSSGFRSAYAREDRKGVQAV